ncbi:outer membrane protein assembly factor BamC [Klebsiella pneumoniae]|nr:outer membrane protein assembly factor BamC [Klebsiella pneumoniae]
MGSPGDYKLQVGDLDNRSSLQFGRPERPHLTQSQNDALVAVFQARLTSNQKGWTIRPLFHV